MKSKFNIVEGFVPATPRSQRKKNAAAGGGSTVVVEGSGGEGSVTDPNSHTHTNLPLLESLSDQDGYLTRKEENPDTGENADPFVYTKVKAGFADKAGDSEKWNGKTFADFLDQPVRKEDAVEHKSVTVSERVTSKDFRQGDFSGSGFGLYRDANGNAVAEVDILKARKEAVFNTAIINQVTFKIGATVFSNGGCEIARVEELDDVYRCYYDTKEGRRLCGLVAYDQVRCQRYDPSQHTIVKYYWRLVMSVGDDYVDLSKTDADGTGVPEEGDEIAQFGHRTDKTRQGATIIDPKDGSSVVVYSEINSYSLVKKNFVGMGTNLQTGRPYLYCYGDFFLGDRELKNQFLTFQIPEGQTVPQLIGELNIRLGAGSSGLDNLTEWGEKQQQIDDAQKAAEDAQSAVDRLEPATRNLALNSGGELSFSERWDPLYLELEEQPEMGAEYTLSWDDLQWEGPENTIHIRLWAGSYIGSVYIFYTTEKGPGSITITIPDTFRPDLTYRLLFMFNSAGNSGFAKNVMWARGNKRVPWTPAMGDMQAEIDAAQQAADNAKETANKAITDLGIIQSDDYVSAVEKTALKQQQADIQAEYPQIIAEAEKYGFTNVPGDWEVTPEYWEQGTSSPSSTGDSWETSKYESAYAVRLQNLLHGASGCTFSVASGYRVMAVLFNESGGYISKTGLAQTVSVTDDSVSYIGLVVDKGATTVFAPDNIANAGLTVTTTSGGTPDISDASNWEGGMVGASDFDIGTPYDETKWSDGSTVYLRTKNAIPNPGGMLTIEAPYEIVVYYYDDNKLYVKDFSPFSREITLKDYPYLGISLRYYDYDNKEFVDVSPDDITDSGISFSEGGGGNSGGGDVYPTVNLPDPLLVAFTEAYKAANNALTKYTASTPDNIPTESDFGNIAKYYPARQIILDAIADAAKKYVDDKVGEVESKVSDLDYLKGVFPDAMVDVNGVVLAQLMGVKSSTASDAAVVAGLYGGSDETLNAAGFKDPTHGILMMFAGAQNVQSAASAATRIYGDGHIVTNDIEASGGKFGIFNIGIDEFGHNSINYSAVSSDLPSYVIQNIITGQYIDIYGHDEADPSNTNSIVLSVGPSSFAEGIVNIYGNNSPLLLLRRNEYKDGGVSLRNEGGIFEGINYPVRTIVNGDIIDAFDHVLITSSGSNMSVTLPYNPPPGKELIIYKFSTPKLRLLSHDQILTPGAFSSSTYVDIGENESGIVNLIFDGASWNVFYTKSTY